LGSPGRSRGFTVLELLVTTATIGLMVALVLPAINAARESSRDMLCRNNFRQVGIALHSFHETNRHLPTGWHRDPTHRTAFGWASQILPYLDQTNLSARIDFRQAVDSTTNQALRHTTPNVFLCPSDYANQVFAMFAEGQDDNHTSAASVAAYSADPVILAELPASNYVGVFGITDPDVAPDAPGAGVFIQDHSFRFADLLRGQSNTVIVGERTARKLPSTWLGIVMDGEDTVARITGFCEEGPNYVGSDECEFDSRHSGHVNFLYADGHVAAVHNDIAPSIYRTLPTRNE